MTCVPSLLDFGKNALLRYRLASSKERERERDFGSNGDDKCTDKVIVIS